MVTGDPKHETCIYPRLPVHDLQHPQMVRQALRWHLNSKL